MSYTPNPGMHKIGKSYEYRAICDSCGLKVWNWELRLRWDGLWCCSDDWEVRHPLDFYRTRNDTHKLPFIRSDGNVADPQLTWTPTVSNLTLTAVGLESIAGDATGTYTLNTTDPGPSNTYPSGSTSCEYRLARSTVVLEGLSASASIDTANPISTSSAVSATITLPTTPTYAGTYTIRNNIGHMNAQGAVPAGSSTLTVANFKSTGNLFFSCYYGT